MWPAWCGECVLTRNHCFIAWPPLSMRSHASTATGQWRRRISNGLRGRGQRQGRAGQQYGGEYQEGASGEAQDAEHRAHITSRRRHDDVCATQETRGGEQTPPVHPMHAAAPRCGLHADRPSKHCAAPVLHRRLRSTVWGTQWASRKRIGRRRALSTGKRASTKSKPAPPTRCCRQILPSSRAAPAQTLSSLSLTSAPAVHFPTFSAVCICLALLHPRESPDKAHPSSPKIEVIGRHRIYCVNRQAPSPLLHG